MDVLEFQANPVTETFTRHGKSMPVTFNTDAFTPDFFRAAAQMFRDIHREAKVGDEQATEAYKKAKKDENEKSALGFEAQARRLEIQREIYARLLAGTPDTPVLMDWELTRKILLSPDEVKNGAEPEYRIETIPINYGELNRLHPDFITDLYNFCLEHSVPKSPEIPMTAASPTISETTDAGSPTPAIRQVENPAM